MTEQPHTYQGIFSDKHGTRDIVVSNDFDVFSLEIDGVRFEGDSLDDLQIINKKNYTAEQLERLTLINDTILDYTIFVNVPQMIINNADGAQLSTLMEIEWELVGLTENGKNIEYRQLKLRLIIGEELFEGTCKDYFDYALDQIIEQFNGRYSFKNCYGCLYSDYSPYGQNTFGGMYCFVRQKEDYLTIDIPAGSYKYNYMAHLTNDYSITQETYCCNHFKQRIKGTGHRG